MALVGLKDKKEKYNLQFTIDGVEGNPEYHRIKRVSFKRNSGDASVRGGCVGRGGEGYKIIWFLATVRASKAFALSTQ